MKCLKTDGVKGIKADCKQLFYNQHTLQIGSKEIIKMKKDGIITYRDLIITRFLFKFNFATPEQIYKFLSNEHPDMSSSVEAITIRLDKLVQYRVLNKFIMVKDHDIPAKDYDEHVNDALVVYCMDLGGRYLLANHSNEDTSNWYTVETMKSSELVKKELMITEFYNNLISTCGPKVVMFNVSPQMRLGRTQIIPSFDFVLNHNGENVPYVGEIVLEIDIPVEFRNKSFLLESLMTTRCWETYYFDSKRPPAALFIAETDIVALQASKLFLGTTEIEQFRVSTIDRIKKPFYEAGVFMKYVERIDELEEVISNVFKQ